jgi:hypothetical protein
MDKNIKFNLGAEGYVPSNNNRSNNNQQQNNYSNNQYNNRGVEETSDYKNNNNAYNYYNDNYSNYQNKNNKNQYNNQYSNNQYDNSQYNNQYNNYYQSDNSQGQQNSQYSQGEDYQNKNQNTYYNNQYSESQDYSQGNKNNYSNKKGEQYNKKSNYSNKNYQNNNFQNNSYNQNNNQNNYYKDQSQSQGLIQNQNNYNENYQNTTNYNNKSKTSYDKNKSNKNSNYNQNNYNTYSQQKGSNNYNNKTDNYNKNSYSQQKGTNNYNDNNKNNYNTYDTYDSGKNNSKTIVKDLTEKDYHQQDIEDDYFGEENTGNFKDYKEEAYNDLDEDTNYEDFNEGDLNDDLMYEDTGDFEDEYDYNQSSKTSSSQSYNTKQITDKFSNITLDKNYNPNASQKKRLIFSNKEGFTDYVEEILKQEKRNYPEINDSYVNVLMIAEKPSIAKAVAEALSSGKINNKRVGGCVFITFDGYFFNTKAKFTVSSVMGHVYTSDFQSIHNKWDSIDFLDLYDVAVAKVDANKKTRITSTLQRLGAGKDILCLWLDCDKEGENICYEVIHNVYPNMNKKNYQQIYRAKFSSLTKNDLKTAFKNLHERPNKNQSLSVDARQVIDLKIGVSFTRFLTSAILPCLQLSDTNLLSYGPCQTPTLWFCVNRENEIDKFVSKEYFKAIVVVEYFKMKYEIKYNKNFKDRTELDTFLAKIKDAKTAKVTNVKTTVKSKPPPAGLNTVQMLRVASSYLKISPHATMKVAEQLYTRGYITYPSTETTKYAPGFDFYKAVNDFVGHSTFGKQASAMVKNFKR